MDTTPLIDGLHIDGPLGWGGPAKVWKGHTDAGDVVVVRTIPKGKIPRQTQTRRLEALAEVGGGHVARLLGLHERPACFYLVSEFITGPALATVRTGGGGLSMPEAWRLLADLCAGLSELHQVGVVHGDVSPANVLLRTDGGRARPVLIDLGGSDEWELGTVGFRAPELSLGYPPSAAADVWSAARIATWAVADDERWQFAASLTAALHEEPAQRPRAEDLRAEAESQASAAITLPEPARLAGAQLRAQFEHVPTRMARRARVRDRRSRAAWPAQPARPMRGPRHARVGSQWIRGAVVAAALVVGTVLMGQVVSAVFFPAVFPGPTTALSRGPSPVWSIHGLSVDPAQIALDLTASRDSALSAGNPAVLREVTVPGSPAAIADADLLEAFKGATPSRLRTAARVVGVSGTKDTPIVSLELTQAAFTWEGGTRAGVRVTVTPQRCANMHLAEYEGSWRVADVGPCDPAVRASN